MFSSVIMPLEWSAQLYLSFPKEIQKDKDYLSLQR